MVVQNTLLIIQFRKKRNFKRFIHITIYTIKETISTVHYRQYTLYYGIFYFKKIYTGTLHKINVHSTIKDTTKGLYDISYTLIGIKYILSNIKILHYISNQLPPYNIYCTLHTTYITIYK